MPQDLRTLSNSDLRTLCSEIRKIILETVAKNGGHLASNLGVVELTIALHRVFESPKDAIIFDVSHQCYTHKILTGRFENFSTLRLHNGISGFTRSKESPHDFFDSGHASTAISQGLGLLTARKLRGESGKVVVVLGDGALTGGMAIEALNHAGQISKDLIIVLNDNKMSIEKNTGAISSYLSRLTMTSAYQNFRQKIDSLIDKIPNSNRHFGKFVYRIKRALKGLLFSTNFFSDLGFEYVGPLRGHRILHLEKVFSRVKNLNRPVVVHVVTKKGFGYSPAENDPSAFHGIGPFAISDGSVEKFDSPSFTECFRAEIVRQAEQNPKIVAVTAAMAKGTGLDFFMRRFPDRFFDVGIAEEHAVTFAAGLSRGKMIPIVAIYSTFFQRAVDQIIEDVALSNFHVIFAADRAGPVPADGETHQGLFDISLMRSVPNMKILSPATKKDLELSLDWAIKTNGPIFIRYPKSVCPSEIENFSAPFQEGRGILVRSQDFASALYSNLNFESEKNENPPKKILFCCTGSIFSETIQAARLLLLKEITADIYSLRFLQPIDENYFFDLAKNYSAVIFVEDGILSGGISEYLERLLLRKNFFDCKVKAFPTSFFSHGTRAQILEEAKMSPSDLANAALKIISKS